MFWYHACTTCRRPCWISPYHLRIDWLMWFAAFQNYQVLLYTQHVLHMNDRLLCYQFFVFLCGISLALSLVGALGCETPERRSSDCTAVGSRWQSICCSSWRLLSSAAVCEGRTIRGIDVLLHCYNDIAHAFRTTSNVCFFV